MHKTSVIRTSAHLHIEMRLPARTYRSVRAGICHGLIPTEVGTGSLRRQDRFPKNVSVYFLTLVGWADTALNSQAAASPARYVQCYCCAIIFN